MPKILQGQVWTRLERVLKSGAVAVAGELACLDTADSGALVAGAVSTTLLPIGHFESSLTGDGTATVFVKLFRPIYVTQVISSATGPVTDANVGALTYIHNADSNVSMTATGKSVAGRVWGVTGTTVYLEAGVKA